MSHNITMKNGKAEMAYVGETPWHGLGQELQRGASIETWCQAAGMDWKVQRSKVRYFADKNGAQQLEWPDKHVLFRSDTQAPLGVVSDHYKVVQPKEVLEFFRDLTTQNKFSLETAGTLKGGAIYWGLAKIHEDAEVGPGDQMKGYVLLSTSADGSRPSNAKDTTVRVVCNNTLSAADAEKGKSEVRVSHRSVFDVDAVKSDLGIARDSFERFMVSARQLAKRKMSPQDMAEFTLRMLGGFVAGTPGLRTPNDTMYAGSNFEKFQEVLASKHAQGIATLYAGSGRGASLPTAKGTAWGAVNAVTEYVDYYYPARSDDNRLLSAWFGQGMRLKDKALALGLEYANA